MAIAFQNEIANQVPGALTRTPPPFTELYFTNQSRLPQSLSLSGSNPFGFTVVNHEGDDLVYSYVVTLASSRGSSTIAQGRIFLRDKAEETRLVDVRPSQRATLYVITVDLVGRSESIWFRAVSQ